MEFVWRRNILGTTPDVCESPHFIVEFLIVI